MQLIQTLLSNLTTGTFIGLSVVTTELVSVIMQIGILYYLYKMTSKEKRGKHFYHLAIILATGAYSIFVVTVVELSLKPFVFFPPLLFKGLSRLEIGMMILQFDAILSFFMGLTSQPLQSKKIRYIYRGCRIISAGFIAFFVGWTLHTFAFQYLEKPFPLPQMVLFGEGFYILEGMFALGMAIYYFRKEKISLLRHHIFTLSFYYMLPYLFWRLCTTDFMNPVVQFPGATGGFNRYMYPVLSIWFTGMMYYVVRKLLGMRFLNISAHVESRSWEKTRFVDRLKVLLTKLSTTSRLADMEPLIQDLFSHTFHMPQDKINLYFRESTKPENDEPFAPVPSPEEMYAEKVLSGHDTHRAVLAFIKRNKIIIRDEVEFTKLYSRRVDEGETLRQVIEFMRKIKADIFLSIYKDEKLLGYLIVREGARPHKFFTDMERDEMLIVSDYLGTFMYLLAHINLEALQLRERELMAEVYRKDQTLELLKRSIHTYLGANMTRKVGVLAYKNKEFSYCNQIAKDILQADLNKDKGLSITQRMMKMGHDATVFRSTKREVLQAISGKNVIVTASPNLHKNNAVITVANPTVADIVKDELRMLKDQTKWDYLLGLKSTDEGGIINRLIPADTPTLLNFKVLFFEYALTCKVILFEILSEEDSLSFAHTVHNINHRKIFEELTVHRNVDDEGLAIKLFGINPLFATSQQERSLFSMLSGKGTLYISNVHLLSLSMQEKLLEYLVTGKYTPEKSDEPIEADVLLLCASNQNLQDLVQRGLFLKELYLELKKTSIWLPSLSSLREDEFLSLTEGLRKQVVYAKLYQSMLEFTERDKSKLLSSGCVSLFELKTKIQGLMLKKTRKQEIDQVQVIDPAYRVVDLELAEAARLGRHALKDPKILAMLLNKFKGNQTKVANFLGVNRSTISRRCAQYDLPMPTATPRSSDEVQA